MPSKGLRTERDQGTPVGYQQLTVTGAAKSLTVPAGMVTYAFIEVQANPIRVRFDGTAPDAATGHILNPGQSDVWNEMELRNAQMVPTGGDAVVAVTFYKS